MSALATPLPLRRSHADLRRFWLVVVVSVVLAVGSVASLAYGTIAVPWPNVLGVVSGWDDTVPALHRQVVWTLRVPRVLLGVLVGASLGASGALVQGWFRNPLADPGLLGISGGAMLAVAVVFVLGGALGITVTWAVPAAAMGGGLAAALLVQLLGRAPGGVPSITTMLLAGIAIQAFVAAATGLLLALSDDASLRDFTFWTLGSLGAASWAQLAWAAPLMALGLVAACALASSLDAMLLGERTAKHLGVDPVRLQRRVVVVVAGLVGVAVSTSGLIGFVGLVSPHLVRMVLGPLHRGVIPGAAVVGAALMVWADLGSRAIAPPIELPVGAITTVIGVPLFVVLLVRAAAGAR